MDSNLETLTEKEKGNLAPGVDSAMDGNDENDVNHENEINCDDNDDDDDDSLLVDIPMFGAPGEVPPKIMEQPPDGFQWNDNAIVECFQMALETHDEKDKEVSFEWFSSGQSSSDQQFLSDWKPKSLSLPLWAKDPFVDLWNDTEKKNESNST